MAAISPNITQKGERESRERESREALLAADADTAGQEWAVSEC